MPLEKEGRSRGISFSLRLFWGGMRLAKRATATTATTYTHFKSNFSLFDTLAAGGKQDAALFVKRSGREELFGGNGKKEVLEGQEHGLLSYVNFSCIPPTSSHPHGCCTPPETTSEKKKKEDWTSLEKRGRRFLDTGQWDDQ